MLTVISKYRTVRYDMAAAPSKKDRILAMARPLFLSKGFDGATTDALVQSAGVSKETLYRYYATKDELLVAVIEDVVERRRAIVAEAILPERATRRTLELLLRRVVERAVAQTSEPEYLGLLRLVVSESGRRPRLAALFRQTLTGGGALRRLLAEAQGQGIVRKDVKVDAAAQMLGGSVLAAVVDQGLLGGARGAHRVAIDVEETVRLFVRAVTG